MVAVIAILAMLRSCAGITINPLGPSEPDPVVDPIDNPDPGPTDPDPVTPVVTNARAKRFKAKGNGQDTVTIMVYMCGTDLESNYGMATSDLVEMTKATISDNVNIIVETGGCKQWKNNIVSNKTNQIYRVVSGGLETLSNDLGAASMVKPGTLSSFIQFCTRNYPADRNILIFWDHGGGSITGYGYDEKMGGNDSMTLDEIAKALKDGGCVFDWIGFDACLMATYETATVCDTCADYLIASEESEPGTGWYYTNWITALSQNTSIDTVALGKIIVDDFISTSVKAQSNAQVTLSVTDLAELEGVYGTFSTFSEATSNLLSTNKYSTVSNARAGVRQFAASSRLNQVDLIDLADRMSITEAKSLASALRSAIKYNKSSMNKAYGLSIYFPYESMSSMSSATNLMNAIGFDASYTKCIKNFASMASGGQMGASSGYGYNYGSSGGLDLGSLLGGAYSSGSSSSYSSGYSDYGTGSLLGSLLGGYTNSSGQTSSGSSVSASDIASLLSALSGRSVTGNGAEWFDTSVAARSAEYISKNYIDPGDLFLSEKNGKRVLTLTQSQWDLIQSCELNVFVDDGEGFIDLGLDNVFEFDGNSLLLDYDNTWLTVNGQIVAYYMISDTEDSDGSWTTTGRIPAILTSTVDGEKVSQYVDLQVVFNEKNKSGVITGATVCYLDGNGTQAKGMIEIKNGDKLQFLCDYYTYDGEYDSTYTLGKPITVGSSGLKLAMMDIGRQKCSVTYRLTDIYSNYFWTPAWTTD